MTKAAATHSVAVEGRMMNSSTRRTTFCFALVASLGSLLLGSALVNNAAAASGVRFQRPGTSQNANGNAQFRRPGSESVARAEKQPQAVPAPIPDRVDRADVVQYAAEPYEDEYSDVVEIPPTTQVVRTQQKTQRNPRVARAARSRPRHNSQADTQLRFASYGCESCNSEPCMCGESYYGDDGYGGGGYCDGGCSDGGCACGDYCEPGCGCAEPGCGIGEPGCGLAEPGCGVAEPSCGCGEVGCGSCVGIPGADYFCFPVWLPRFKDLSVWGGVQGFRGPRDFAGGRSDSNFGFNEGINISGRAPLVGLIMPQLSYQLGYRAVQSRLHGTVDTSNDRSQQFVTAGFFRRVNTGLQGGVVWDLLRDDLDESTDAHQVRYELSLKSPQGREIGFFGTSSSNTVSVLGQDYEAVDQYAGFIRWAFGKGYESRLWGGSTGDGEGIFGGEFYAPLSDRWTVQSGFNYLITDLENGPAAVREESWNIGINLVWHLGSTAKRGCRSPFRPLFSVADNGWMFIDRAP